MTQWLTDLRVRISALFGRRALRDRLDEEIRLHLEMRTAQLVEEGLTPNAAFEKARREFGNLPVLREAAMDTWRYGSMERLIQDVRYAVRTLARSPGFTAVAVLSLALGIGANAAIFTLVDRIMLRFLPVEAPSELVIFSGGQPYPRYEHFVEQGKQALSGVLGFAAVSQVGVDGDTNEVNFANGRLVSGNYFEVLGVKPMLGRLLTAEDNVTPAGHPLVVISNAFWLRHFGGDPAALGRTIRLSPGSLSSGSNTGGFEQHQDAAGAVSSGRFTVIGVTQPGFFGETVGQHPDFWVPIMMQEHFMPGRPWLKRKTASWVQVMGRLKPGFSREQAQASMNVVFQQALVEEAGGAPSGEERRQIAQRKLELREGDKGFSSVRGQFSQPLLVLMAMVGVVLLIACANLANLLLARATARRREISIRLAMGAGRGRLVRQLLTESVVLALLGAAAAVAVAWWGSQTMFAMVSEGNRSLRLDLAPDARTFVFTGILGLLTALLFGLAPALRGTRLDVNSVLKEGGRTAATGWNLGRVLVAAQVALSVVLLIGTGLFTRTLWNMRAQDFGYSADNLILMRVDPISAGYRGDDIGRACKNLLDKIRTIPGVRSATFSENGLFSGTESGAGVRIEGYTPANDRDKIVRFDQVGPGYFTNVGIPLLLGRDFTDADDAKAPRVAVINENMARFYFGGRSPLGQQIHYDDEDKFTLTIVGVAKDARDHSMRTQVHRRMYVPFLQPVDGLTGANYEVRTSLEAAIIARQLRATVAETAPNMPVNDIKTLTTLVDESLLRERMIGKLAVLFGIIAIVLASVGLYGILAYSVARRTNEIGIRIAIGAFPQSIVWMVVRETAVLVAAGLVAGVPVALGLSRFVESLLYGLKPNDAGTIVLVVGLMAVIAAAAAVVPARRAAGVDPVTALRYE